MPPLAISPNVWTFPTHREVLSRRERRHLQSDRGPGVADGGHRWSLWAMAGRAGVKRDNVPRRPESRAKSADGLEVRTRVAVCVLVPDGRSPGPVRDESARSRGTRRTSVRQGWDGGDRRPRCRVVIPTRRCRRRAEPSSHTRLVIV